jgi:hypothetical protein
MDSKLGVNKISSYLTKNKLPLRYKKQPCNTYKTHCLGLIHSI